MVFLSCKVYTCLDYCWHEYDREQLESVMVSRYWGDESRWSLLQREHTERILSAATVELENTEDWTEM